MKNENDSTADVRLGRMVSLRPCPFCGGEAELLFWGSKPDAVACNVCGAQSDIDPWNRRADDVRVQMLVAALKQVRMDIANFPASFGFDITTLPVIDAAINQANARNQRQP